jgi:hypothetical protein
MKKLLLILTLLVTLLPLAAFAQSFNYYIVPPSACPGDVGCFKPTSSKSYPAVMGTYTDDYGTTIRRMIGETGCYYESDCQVPPNYTSRINAIENANRTLVQVGGSKHSVYPISTNIHFYSIADGVYRGNTGAYQNNVGSVNNDHFQWSQTEPYVGYLFAGSAPGWEEQGPPYYGAPRYNRFPAKFWKITIDPNTVNPDSTYLITGTLLYTIPQSALPACPPNETILQVANHDEASPSWDGRYWSLIHNCTLDYGENLAYSVLLLDRDLNGYEQPGIKGYIVLPYRNAYSAGVTPLGTYWWWRDYWNTCHLLPSPYTHDGACILGYPTAEVNGPMSFEGQTVFFTGGTAVGGHFAQGVDDLGNEIYIAPCPDPNGGYGYGYYKFNTPSHSTNDCIITLTNLQQVNKSSIYDSMHSNGHVAVVGTTPETRMWTALVETGGSSTTDECGNENNGASTITFFRNSATNKKVWRVAHERHEATSYSYQAWGGPGRNGATFYFTSNWCGAQNPPQLFQVSLPPNWWINIDGSTDTTPPAAPTGVTVN